ncbi:MAG: response regulator transcription factor [Clostridiales bacterium]|nr:response regulator transcription factor [Clostridiales bacterium]
MSKDTVLVLLDDQEKSVKISKYLKDAGFKSAGASNLADAEKLISGEDIDLVITDDKVGVTKRFMHIGIIRSLTAAPVIIYSAKASIIDKTSGYEAGCDDYLSGTADIEELMLHVSSLIRRARKSDNILVEFPPLTMNLKTREVTLDGKPVKLTNREFEIVYLLAETPNKTVGISEIYKKVWGEDTPCDNHLVMVNISYIRKKFEKILPDRSFIKTSWGVGYSFTYPPVPAN